MTMDSILELISQKGEYEQMLMPLRAFDGEKSVYLELGVFKRSGHVREEVACPNGCGEYVKVLSRQNGTYFVVCDHGGKEMEDVDVPAEDVELCEFDRVVFDRCIKSGTIDYVPPSTAQDREGNPVKAKAFLQQVAKAVRKTCKIKKCTMLQDYIFRDAMPGDAHYRECEELRKLQNVHGWLDSTIGTYIRNAFAGGSRTKTIKRQSGKKTKKRKVKASLSDCI